MSGLSIALQCRSRSKSKYYALSLIVLSLSAKGESGATVPFYNLEGNLKCALPIDTLIQTGRPSLDFEGYIQVTPSSLGSSACGNEPGLVSQSKLVHLTHRRIQIAGKPKVFRATVHIVRKDVQSGLRGQTEAGSFANCQGCSSKSRSPDPLVGSLEALKAVARASADRAPRQCRPLKENRSQIKPSTNIDIEEEIRDYSQRAQGFIQRGFLALVPPSTDPRHQKLKALTLNFTDFDRVEPRLLKSLMRKGTHDCYRFVKAALSNDYTILSRYNITDYTKPETKANIRLVQSQCGTEKGDLADEHWLSSLAQQGGGAAHKPLKKRGFINLMDSKWGVDHKYFSEKTAPEGSVLVYQCLRNGKVLPSSETCRGDTAIKTKTGYLRDYFTHWPITLNGEYKLMGIYIKPKGELSI